MTQTQSFEFKGKSFQVVRLERFDQDPSWFSFVDESTVRDRDWNIESGDIVLDIGSAYGSYSLTALALGASMVLAFNPNEDENAMLVKNAGLNGWEDRLDVYESGLYSADGHLDDVGQNFLPDDPRITIPSGFFAVKSLDSYVLGLPGSGKIWLKLDVEGAEVEVLRGATKFLLENRSRLKILVECHTFKGATLVAQVQGFLESLGFRHIATHPHHGVHHSLYTGLVE